MMKIRARLYGTARRFSNKRTPGIWEGELPERATVAELITIIGSSRREISAAAVDGINVSFDTVLDERMDIVLVTAVGGG